MIACIKLNYYKFKSDRLSFALMLLGIFSFGWISIYVKKSSVYVNFDDTRMTTFLIIFSSTLLILVRYSTSISSEWEILQRDFFSGLQKYWYWVITAASHCVLALVEAVFFLLFYQINLDLFNIKLPHGVVLLNTLLPIFLAFSCAHFIALIISLSVNGNTTVAVVVSVVFAIFQFTLANTVMPLPKALEPFDKFIFLSPAHRAFGIVGKIGDLPISMANYGVKLPSEQLAMFSSTAHHLSTDVGLLWIHFLAYFFAFGILVFFRIKSRQNRSFQRINLILQGLKKGNFR